MALGLALEGGLLITEGSAVSLGPVGIEGGLLTVGTGEHLSSQKNAESFTGKGTEGEHFSDKTGDRLAGYG